MNRPRQHRLGITLADRLTRATRIAAAALITMAMTTGLAQPSRARSTPAPATTARPVTGHTIGVTHTQYSADAYHPAARQAEQILRRVGRVQNQHIMGFGAGNPQPRPGVYDWRTLDARMGLIARTGGTPVITLCCAPDWMKGGKPGTTDWSRLTVAPRAKHFDDFAKLAAAVARRYPQVGTYLVWNELKGFYDPRSNRWNIKAYTRLYNKVYAALKAVNPKIEVGGPYVVMDSFSSARSAGRSSELTGNWGVLDQRALDAVRYWLRHKRGADFIAVDARSGTRDRGLVVKDVAAVEKFVAVNHWLRRQTDLPIWWAEIYPEVDDPHASSSSPHRAAVALYALIKVIASGASAVLLWQPQQDQALRSVALWTDARARGGGRPLSLVEPLTWVQNALAAGRPVTAWWNGVATVARDGRSTLILEAKTGRTTIYPFR